MFQRLKHGFRLKCFKSFVKYRALLNPECPFSPLFALLCPILCALLNAYHVSFNLLCALLGHPLPFSRPSDTPGFLSIPGACENFSVYMYLVLYSYVVCNKCYIKSYFTLICI